MCSVESYKRSMSDSPDAAQNKKARVEVTTNHLLEVISVPKLRRIMRNLPHAMANLSKDKADAMERMIKTLANRVDSKGRLVVEYSKSEHGFGRRWARGPGMQGMVKLLRHELADDRYLDADMVNAHPTLLYQLCVMYGYDSRAPNLRSLVENRDAVVEYLRDKTNTLTREEMKEKIAAALFTYPGKCNEHLKPLNADMTVLYELAKEHFPAIVRAGAEAARVKRPGNPNIQGSVVSLLAQHMETIVMDAAVEYCKYIGVIVPGEVVLPDGRIVEYAGEYVDTFDGLQLPAKVVKERMLGGDIDGLLHGMQEAILEATGFRVQFKYKPMSMRIPHLPEIDEGEDDGYKVVVEHDDQASRVIIRMMEGRLVKCEGNVYVRQGPIWTLGKSAESALLDFILSTNLVKPVGDEGATRPYSKDVAGARHIREAVLARVPEDPTFSARAWESTLGKTVFRNGYWDWNQKCFVEGFDGVDSFIMINRDYCPKRNEELEKQIHDLLIDPIYGNQLGEVLMHWLARGAAGCPDDKQWGVQIGGRDAGKGTIQSLLQTTLGPYVAGGDIKNFMIHAKSKPNPITDIGRANAWKMLYEHARLCLPNESKTMEGYKFDGEEIKGLTGGSSDVFIGRQLYQEAKGFRVQARFLFSVNSFPGIHEPDCAKHLFAYELKNVFIDDYDALRAAGKLEDHHRRADDTIKTGFCKRADVGMSFFHMLADSYKSTKAVPTKEMVEFRSACIVDFDPEVAIDEIFEFTAKYDDFLTKEDVETQLAFHDAGTYTQFVRILRRKCKGMVGGRPTGDRQRINGVRHYLLRGVILRPHPKDDDGGSF